MSNDLVAHHRLAVWTAGERSADAQDETTLSLDLVGSGGGPSEYINQLSDSLLTLAQILMPDDGNGIELTFLATEHLQALAGKAWRELMVTIPTMKRGFEVNHTVLSGQAVVTDANAASGIFELGASRSTAKPREWHTNSFLSTIMQVAIAKLLMETLGKIESFSHRGASQLSEDLTYFSNVSAVFSAAGTTELLRAKDLLIEGS